MPRGCDYEPKNNLLPALLKPGSGRQSCDLCCGWPNYYRKFGAITALPSLPPTDPFAGGDLHAWLSWLTHMPMPTDTYRMRAYAGQHAHRPLRPGVCVCARPGKIARARACICISRIVHHNLATRVRTQLSMPQEHARTGTHSRACTQEADSDSDAAEAPSDSDSATEPSDGRGDDIVADSESEADAPIGPEPPSNKKRAFQVVVDDEIALEEGQIRAQMVRWSCQLRLQSLRRSLRMILSDCR